MEVHAKNDNLGLDAAAIAEARDGTNAEQEMTLREAVKLYPAAIAWSILLSTALVMEGYDIVLLGSFFGYPSFVQKYGDLGTDGTYNISAAWQSGLSNGAFMGELFGLWVVGFASERYGYRRTMLVSLAASICFIFIPFFAPNRPVLLVGEICMGIPWGMWQTLSTAYASEVCPTALRAHLTTYVNLCWVMGQLIASGVLRGLLGRTDEWAYRIPFAIQWFWPVPILIGCIFVPESPWWLVRHGRLDEARTTLLRLTSRSAENTAFNVDNTLAMIVHTNALEEEAQAGTSYFDCFKGVDLRRTEIAAGVWSIQNLCGSCFMGYSTYFLESAGLPVEKAFDMSLAQYALGFCGTVLSWFLMQYAGRRTIYIYGLVILCVLLFGIGGAGIAGSDNIAAQWTVGALLLIFTFVYDISVGPICYSLVAEISSTRLRGKTIVIARGVYNVIGCINGIITPYMLNKDSLNWKAKTGFFWGSICVLCIVWCYFRLPEPRGKTYGELDVLFANRVPARAFKNAKADQYSDNGHVSEKMTEKMELTEKIEA